MFEIHVKGRKIMFDPTKETCNEAVPVVEEKTFPKNRKSSPRRNTSSLFEPKQTETTSVLIGFETREGGDVVPVYRYEKHETGTREGKFLTETSVSVILSKTDTEGNSTYVTYDISTDTLTTVKTTKTVDKCYGIDDAIAKVKYLL